MKIIGRISNNYCVASIVSALEIEQSTFFKKEIINCNVIQFSTNNQVCYAFFLAISYLDKFFPLEITAFSISFFKGKI